MEHWGARLTQKRRAKRKTERLEQHKVWVEELLDMTVLKEEQVCLHSSTKKRPWKGGAHRRCF